MVRKMFGTSHDDNNVIKSGIEIVHKAVVHIFSIVQLLEGPPPYLVTFVTPRLL